MNTTATSNRSGRLYLIPNTLGDSELSSVLPQQVCRTAAMLDYFVAENAKSARAFLKKIDGVQPLARRLQDIEIRELNVSTRPGLVSELLAPILAGRNGGLLSEAGCPAVADPGADLVRLAHKHNVCVCPLIGPSAILLALMASGLNGQSFAFHGYLPTAPAERRQRIRELEQRSLQERQTQIFIETPYRNNALAEALVTACGASTLICIATELSLASETIATRTASAWRGVVPDLNKRPSIFLILAE